ncbi:MAG: hypothetical protein JSV84_08150 [Gemmatimonadota bacterium]|nr:MAG: hypothetical protein JSV84_08150 [Gemmatimonadota bacterium]
MKKISPLYVAVFITAVAVLANCGSKSEVEENVGTKDSAITVGSVVARPGGNVEVPISLESHVDIAGVQLNIQFDSNAVTVDAPRTTSRTADMMVMHNIKERELLLMLYDMSGKTISPGSGPILMLPVNVAQNASGTISLDLTKAMLATQDAQTIPVSSGSGKITIRP